MKRMFTMLGGVMLAGCLVTHAQTAAPAVAPRTADSEGAGPAAADMRTEKQKALARQTEQLFDMATELKAQVDKTNKNILSLKVVQDAEEIEKLAKGIRERSRR